jgi:SAM-dependent methyltransferase
MGGAVDRSSGPDFGEISASYAFFLAHSTETAAQIAALSPLVRATFAGGKAARLLDFGCGDGAFLASVIDRAGVAVGGALSVHLVEPVATLRARAAGRLRRVPGLQVAAAADLEAAATAAFDLILANHSLYYVPDPARTVQALCARCAGGGAIVVAMLDRANALAVLWRAGYAAIGAPFPYCLAEDVADALAACGSAPRATPIAYCIDFPDTAAARGNLVRFLFGPEIAARHGLRLARLFDRHSRGNRIVIETRHPQLVTTVRRP